MSEFLKNIAARGIGTDMGPKAEPRIETTFPPESTPHTLSALTGSTLFAPARPTTRPADRATPSANEGHNTPRPLPDAENDSDAESSPADQEAVKERDTREKPDAPQEPPEQRQRTEATPDTSRDAERETGSHGPGKTDITPRPSPQHAEPERASLSPKPRGISDEADTPGQGEARGPTRGLRQETMDPRESDDSVVRAKVRPAARSPENTPAPPSKIIVQQQSADTQGPSHPETGESNTHTDERASAEPPEPERITQTILRPAEPERKPPRLPRRRPAEPDPARSREVNVHIGTVEVRAEGQSQPSPAPRPGPTGFGDYTMMRCYVPGAERRSRP